MDSVTLFLSFNGQLNLSSLKPFLFASMPAKFSRTEDKKSLKNIQLVIRQFLF